MLKIVNQIKRKMELSNSIDPHLGGEVSVGNMTESSSR